jgi:regulator of CtrA degradation
MSEPASINPHIVEGLYCEALVLADEIRAAFALDRRTDPPGQDEDLVRIALSCEGLRTTTRIMHALAWLLNQRSYFMGELSEFQLRRHGKLSRDLKVPDPDNMALLSPAIRNRAVLPAADPARWRMAADPAASAERAGSPAQPGAAQRLKVLPRPQPVHRATPRAAHLAPHRSSAA